MGRKKGTGYQSQMYILLVLRDCTPSYGKQIVEKTGLHREEVWRNLKVLSIRGIIKGEKVGVKTYYKPLVNQKTLEYIIHILSEGGLRKVKRNLEEKLKNLKKAGKFIKNAKEYEGEFIQLGTSRTTPYVEELRFAIEQRITNIEWGRILYGSKHRIITTNSQEKNRKIASIPKIVQTKKVMLPSGLPVVIKKPTILQLIDIFNEVKKVKEPYKPDSDLIEAIRLLSVEIY